MSDTAPSSAQTAPSASSPGASSPAEFDLLCIGNAIVDVISSVDDAFLTERGMTKGTMRLVGRDEAEALYAAMPPGVESSGGSAANTAASAARLGLRVAFAGKVAEDQLGAVFRHDIRASGVRFDTPPAQGAESTARSLILVTPDGQRTMNTYLGAAAGFSEADLEAELIARSRVIYLEGYLFDPPAAQAAFRKAAEIARAAGGKVAISLSDPFCVGRHRAAFLDLLGGIDILFANEAEITSLFETVDFAAAAEAAAARVPLAVLTRSERGSLIVAGTERAMVPAAPARVVDTTGAGDAYAAGFLAGYCRGLGLAESGWLGARAAAAVIGHFGARPLGADLDELAAQLRGKG